MFGDPCAGITEFLEVQFQCFKPQLEEEVRVPTFSDDNIAMVWNNDDNNNNIADLIFEKITLYNAPRRIPITEAPRNKFDDAELLKESSYFTQSQDYIITESEKRTVFISALACLIMLPCIVTLTIFIIKTKNSKTQKISHESEYQYPCLMERHKDGTNLIFCRLDSTLKGSPTPTRQYSSEPDLIRHKYLLL